MRGVLLSVVAACGRIGFDTDVEGEFPEVSPATCMEVGRFAQYCGKVNVHLVGSDWITDGDCSSGCNVGGVEYCQKFYPEAIDLVQLKPSPKPAVWMNAGCRPVPDAVDGNREFACCAAMP